MTIISDAPAEPGAANDGDGKSAELLRIPQHFHSVDDVLGVAAKLELEKILVLSDRPNGALVFLDNGLTFAETNWLIDRLKHLMLSIPPI